MSRPERLATDRLADNTRPHWPRHKLVKDHIAANNELTAMMKEKQIPMAADDQGRTAIAQRQQPPQSLT